MTAKEIGSTLCLQRKNLGISQETLAEISGVSVRTIKAVENGANTSLSTLLKILEPVGLTLVTAKRINL